MSLGKYYNSTTKPIFEQERETRLCEMKLDTRVGLNIVSVIVFILYKTGPPWQCKKRSVHCWSLGFKCFDHKWKTPFSWIHMTPGCLDLTARNALLPLLSSAVDQNWFQVIFTTNESPTESLVMLRLHVGETWSVISLLLYIMAAAHIIPIMRTWIRIWILDYCRLSQFFLI